MEFNPDMRRVALAAGLALAALGAAAQGQGHPATDAGLDCRQLRAELAALAAGGQGRLPPPPLPPLPPVSPVQMGQAAQGAPGSPDAAAMAARDAAQLQAQAAAAAQVAALQAAAQQRSAAAPGRNQGEAAGVVSMLGAPLSAAQAAQPVTVPGNATIRQLAGSRQDQLGGLLLAKGCT